MKFKQQVSDVFARREAANQPCEGESDTIIGHIRTIITAVRILQGAKWYLIRYVVKSVIVAALLISAVVYLNAKGVLSPRPTPSQPKTAQNTTIVAMTAPPVAQPPQVAAVQGLAAPQPSATPTRAQPSATPVQVSPNLLALPGNLGATTIDAVSDATSALSQLLMAEESGAAETWCSLATTLNVAQCDSVLGALWTVRQKSSAANLAAPTTVTVGQPSGAGAAYSFSVNYGERSVLVTMEWDGQHWHLSGNDYQQALLSGGILTPLIGNLTSVVLNLL